MCAQPAHRRNNGRVQSGPGSARPTKNSIRKMAVLFTDVVGSSKYFKAHGDLAGREMLRRHQELASLPVTEHSGVVVKVLGDSVMAYFTDPGEALKAAVKIQRRFFRHNQGKTSQEQIHVRLGVHYGDGIVENGDIYGDVVNIAAKFLPLVGGDQIAVSRELRNQVQGLSWARFEKMDVAVTKEVLKKLVIYRVSWDEQADLNPAVMSVLVLRPAWNLEREGFEKAWKRLLTRKNSLWPRTPGQQAVLSDGTLILYLKTPAMAPRMAGNALRFLKENLGRAALPFLPVQIMVDTGQFKKAGEPFLGSLKDTWSVVKPGEITISPEAMKAIKVPADLTVISPREGDGIPLYRLVPREEGKTDDEVLFLYQSSMVQGAHGPCFYCGDRRHAPAECPSKQLPDTSRGLERLGYHSLETINELFFTYLYSGGGGQNGPNGAPPTSQARDENLAEDAFFELKRVFQLRFLRAIWNSNAESWNQIKSENEDGERGGLVWIGQDCIRVSNLVQAENLLANALEKLPGDFNALCAMGLLQVERGDLKRAKRFFKHALENANIAPRKIFARLLLARAHELSGELRHAEEHVRKVLFMDSLCLEALYLDMIFKFRQGRHGEGVKRLRRLIEANRKMLIAALIDPELAKFSGHVHPEIRAVIDRSRADSERLLTQAVEEIGRMERFLGKDDGELKRARFNLEKMRELSQTDSYFSHLDIIYYATAIIQASQRSHELSRRKLLRAHTKLKERHEACVRLVRAYPYRSFLGSLPRDLDGLGKTVAAIREVIRSNEPEKYKDAMTHATDVSARMDRLEQKLRRLRNLKRWIGFSVAFLKKAVLLEGAIILTSLLLFPVVGHYLSFLIPGLSFSPESIWTYQKGVLILGGLTGLFLAFLMSARKLGEP